MAGRMWMSRAVELMADRKQRERIAEKRLSLFSFHSIWVTSL
jgi:hypothetical protein